MELEDYRSLYEITKTLHLDTGRKELPRLLLDRVIDHTGADKGFIVVREQGSFKEKYQVHFGRDMISPRKRQFSRTLVREAISQGKIIFSEDITEDTRFHEEESVIHLGPCSALVTPIEFQGQIQAVIYLEKHDSRQSFSRRDQDFLNEFSVVAGFAVQRGIELRTLDRLKNIHAREFLEEYDFDGVIGRHPTMMQLLQTVVQVARSDAPLLINGETGTGKEVVAQAVWRNGPRKERPFITVHCGALPETLFEAELFGHKKGSFTGAFQDRAGRVAQAHDGILFLDEVAEIPLAIQAKLLRFIQFGEFQRVGSDTVEKVAPRIVAATHKDLAQMVEEGTFRQDLYYRLNVLDLEVPPLRTRKSDIPLLVDFFLKRFWKRENQTPILDPDTLALLERYPWPGNVRELAHVVERLCVLARGPMLSPGLLPKPLHGNGTESGRKGDRNPVEFTAYSNDELKAARNQATKDAVARVECEFLNGLLELCEGNISRAAETAGMQRPYLHRLIAKYREQ